MAEETSGDVLLHPGLVVSDQDEHGVPEVLPVQVHRAEEVMPGDPAVPQPLLVLHVVSPPDVNSDNIQRLGGHLLLLPLVIDSLKILSDDNGESLLGKL